MYKSEVILKINKADHMIADEIRKKLREKKEKNY